MKQILLLFLAITFLNCSSDDSNKGDTSNGDWLVNSSDISGAFNLFPLSLNPEFTTVSETSLSDGSLVGVVSIGSAVLVFPNDFVYQFEIINTSYNGFDYAFSYCPITKSSIAFKRDQIFRASGYLYKENMTPWDENTETIWSQMLGKAINGDNPNRRLEKIPVLKTSWRTVKDYYPNALVIKQYNRPELAKVPQLPSDEDDDIEMPSDAELTYGIVENNLHNVHTFRYADFRDSKRKDVIIQGGQKYIIYGNASKQVMNAYKVTSFDDFELLDDLEFPYILKSNNIKYDILGNSATGISLQKPEFSYMAAWFAWRDFFDGHLFYPNE
ncbi:hypothetical protein DI383_05215 [Flavobacteriaceae bacterium LYZ1037]|nr:hypothetical protein DI383_05215 [Flavobacteriaceae bacterium LYZ1037]